MKISSLITVIDYSNYKYYQDEFVTTFKVELETEYFYRVFWNVSLYLVEATSGDLLLVMKVPMFRFGMEMSIDIHSYKLVKKTMDSSGDV